MEFTKVLEKYESEINYANRMLSPECLSFYKKTEEYWRGYKKAMYKWLQFMKLHCNFTPETEQMSKKESEQLIYVDEFNNYYYPYQWLVYRGEKIPVYNDDYGQQDFVIYKGKGFYAGAYNMDTLYDFCSFIDTIKDGIE